MSDLGMTRFRLFSTLFVIAVGSAMAVHYLQPDPPSAPERIKAERILPPDTPNQTAPGTAGAEPAVLTTMESAPATPPPTVALPSGPLLRSATEAPPIDTSSLDHAVPVRHDPDASPGLSGRIGGFSNPETDTLDAQPSPIARPTATRRPRSQSDTAQSNKKIEQLFLNPLGVR